MLQSWSTILTIPCKTGSTAWTAAAKKEKKQELSIYSSLASTLFLQSKEKKYIHLFQ